MNFTFLYVVKMVRVSCCFIIYLLNKSRNINIYSNGASAKLRILCRKTFCSRYHRVEQLELA